MKTSKLNLFIYTLDVLGSISGQGVQMSGDSIYIQGSTSVPEVLSQTLADRGNGLKDVTVYAAFAVGRCEAPYLQAGVQGRLQSHKDLLDSYLYRFNVTKGQTKIPFRNIGQMD